MVEYRWLEHSGRESNGRLECGAASADPYGRESDRAPRRRGRVSVDRGRPHARPEPSVVGLPGGDRSPPGTTAPPLASIGDVRLGSPRADAGPAGACRRARVDRPRGVPRLDRAHGRSGRSDRHRHAPRFRRADATRRAARPCPVAAPPSACGGLADVCDRARVRLLDDVHRPGDCGGAWARSTRRTVMSASSCRRSRRSSRGRSPRSTARACSRASPSSRSWPRRSVRLARTSFPGRGAFLVYSGVAVCVFCLYLRLSSNIEPAASEPAGPLGPSRRLVIKLAAVFSLDSLGGGFVVQSLLALWLYRRFDLSVGATGTIFFATGLLSGFSGLLAPALARRIGLIRTMVFTHIPANVLLIATAFMPSLPLAIACLLARSLLSQMDVPARSSYVMAVVTPPERAAAAAATNVPRSLAAALPPLAAGWMLDRTSFGWPLVIGGCAEGRVRPPPVLPVPAHPAPGGTEAVASRTLRRQPLRWVPRGRVPDRRYGPDCPTHPTRNACRRAPQERPLRRVRGRVPGPRPRLGSGPAALPRGTARRARQGAARSAPRGRTGARRCRGRRVVRRHRARRVASRAWGG